MGFFFMLFNKIIGKIFTRYQSGPVDDVMITIT